MELLILIGIGLSMIGIIIYQVIKEAKSPNCLHCSKLCKEGCRYHQKK